MDLFFPNKIKRNAPETVYGQSEGSLLPNVYCIDKFTPTAGLDPARGDNLVHISQRGRETEQNRVRVKGGLPNWIIGQ